MSDSDTAAGRFAYEGLDRVLHEKKRLGILTALLAHPDGLSFGELVRLCDVTDGNLSRHLDALAKANLVKVTKAFVGRRPLTTCALTAHGRKRFREYLLELEQVIRDAAAQASAAPSSAKANPGLAGA